MHVDFLDFCTLGQLYVVLTPLLLFPVAQRTGAVLALFLYTARPLCRQLLFGMTLHELAVQIRRSGFSQFADDHVTDTSGLDGVLKNDTQPFAPGFFGE